jgi:hypothetical protein
MKASRTNLKLGAGLLALVALSGWLGVAPAVRDAERTAEAIRENRESLARSESKIRDIKALANTLTDARVFAASHTRPIAERDISTLMHEISDFLTSMRVTSHELKQDAAIERDGVLITPLNLVMQASYDDLRRLLDRVDAGEHLVRIARIQAELPRGAPPGSPVLNIEVSFESIAPRPRSSLANAAAGGTP